MPDQPTVPLFDEDAVRQVLERLRQAAPLGDSPLRKLIWMQEQAEARGPVTSSAGFDAALGAALSGLICENVSRLRSLEGLPDALSQDREATLITLEADFKQANTELEAWSSLYHRYARLDLNLQVQDISRIVGMASRQLRRRMNHGYRRLTEAISRLESRARVKNWTLWLRSKLPSPSYTALFGLDQAISHLYDLSCAASSPRVVALTGPGGIGKTTLAHAVTRRLLEGEQFRNFTWLTLKEPTAYTTQLALLARDLGHLHLAESPLAELESGLIMCLSERPTLIVLDNADHLDNCAAMLPRLVRLVAEGCLIMTVRRRFPPDAPIRIFPVEPLSRDDFAALLRRYVKMHQVAQPQPLDKQTIDVIYEATGGNPLAGRLVVSQLAILPLNQVLENLSSLKMAQGVGLFDWLFAPTWGAVGGTAQQAALAMLLLSPEGTYWHDLVTATGLDPATLGDALRKLVSGSFVDTSGDEPHYKMHPLARRFVEEQAKRPPWAGQYQRLLQTAVERERLAEDRDAARMMALLQRQAETRESPDALGALITHVAPMARRAGQWLVWRDVLVFVATNLREGGEHPHELARALLELGVAYRWLGESMRAEETLQEAITHFGAQGDFVEQAEALLELGKLHQESGQTDLAYAAYQRSAATAHRYGAARLRCQALNGLAGLALHNDRIDEALDLLHQALETFGDELPDGQTLSALGMAYLGKGDAGQAITHQRQALDWFGEAGDLPNQARTHLRLGMAYHAAGQLDGALKQLEEGLYLTHALGDALGKARLLVNLGVVHTAHEQWNSALAAWKDAIALQRQLGDQVGMAYTWYNLADLQWKMELHDNARAALEQAHTLAQQLNLVSLLAHISKHPLNEAIS